MAFVTLVDIHPFEVDTRQEQPRPRRKFRLTRKWRAFVAAILVLAIPLIYVGVLRGVNFLNERQNLALRGNYAMTQGELKFIVRTHHLAVYWAGPMKSAKYALDTSDPSRITLRYLPNGIGIDQDGANFRIISTYKVKGAFSIVRDAGLNEGALSFVNINGDSVSFTSSDYKNVYMGMQGKNIEVEIYDPRKDQALATAMTHRGIIPIH